MFIFCSLQRTEIEFAKDQGLLALGPLSDFRTKMASATVFPRAAPIHRLLFRGAEKTCL